MLWYLVIYCADVLNKNIEKNVSGNEWCEMKTTWEHYCSFLQRIDINKISHIWSHIIRSDSVWNPSYYVIHMYDKRDFEKYLLSVSASPPFHHRSHHLSTYSIHWYELGAALALDPENFLKGVFWILFFYFKNIDEKIQKCMLKVFHRLAVIFQTGYVEY